MRLLLLDNFDSFTYNLLDYLRQLGVEVVVRRNDTPLPELLALDFDAVVLSPGPGTPRKAGVMMELLAAVYERVPVLGVCLGHQALGEFFGAELRRGARPMHGKVSEIELNIESNIGSNQSAEALFEGLPARIPVTRYHSLVLSQLPAALLPLARTADPSAELMALRHRTLPLYGVQFHPEALLTPHGLALLRNWVRIAYHCTNTAAPAAPPAAHTDHDGIAD
ncbi:anthranilate synthase component II [Hymenobacter jeollabukensis]|uniref:Aminodeoxychorismate/anthranilate synthase component II n=1 Tax=Hymenobacter jeollabukensis TaxID=2025313 RepID=A0A5R8WUK2_9BACT|nr:aminodeoxychorismate/anthranilate synthase component II [Hymenobacter jeollabukensis]TLM95458.1 aminodeoxychorismate/anthranilate synthase component II [Hymenobacter jeollabukensis]